MNAPLVWIFFPGGAGAVLLLFRRRRRWVYGAGIVLALLLTVLAWLVPVDTVVQLGKMEWKLGSTLSILGRSLVLLPEQHLVLVLLFAMTAFWLIGAAFLKGLEALPGCALILAGLVVASLAVSPFLYAAIFLALAGIAAMPLFIPFGRGATRFLTFQTLGMVFLLLSGWLLAGVETAPADHAGVIRILATLGTGFAFLLAIFPFYSWIPMLTEQERAYPAGFVVLLLQTGTLFLFLRFLENYAWLRNSAELRAAMLIAGSVMVVSGGIWSAYQRHLGRMYGYALIVENGLSVMAISLLSGTGLQVFAGMIVPRVLAFGLWGLCLTYLSEQRGSLQLSDLQGAGKQNPLLLMGLLAGQFSASGLPLLAAFPYRVVLLRELSGSSAGAVWAVIIGSIGVWVASWVTLAELTRSDEDWSGRLRERLSASVLVGVGMGVLLLLGLYPQLLASFREGLLALFTHLS